MAFLMDRPRLVLSPPRPFAADEYLFGALSADEIRARLAREPYKEAFRRLLSLARKSAGLELRSRQMPEAQRAHLALALGLSWWLTGSRAHRRRAESALDAAGVGHWDAWCAAPEAIIEYLLAADLLRPSGGFGRHAEEHFVERLGEKVAAGVAVNAQLPQNNWRLCTLSAVGMTAITWWHAQTPWPVGDWLEVALDGLSRLLFGLVSEDGVYLEGPGYSRRSLVALLPFAWACSSRTDLDLVNHPSLAAWLRWLAEVALPDGTNPPIDDSRREKLHPFALLVNRRCRQAPLMRWAADRCDWDRFWELEALLLYDDRIRPRPPAAPPSAVLEQGGMARFRSDWSPRATYGLLVARSQPPLGPGQSDSAHRHDDPTNFLVYAHGELLTHDAGYGGYSHPQRYRWFLTGEAHNLILVDGHGPPRLTSYKGDGRAPNVSTANGRVRLLFSGKDLVVAQAETSYQEVDFLRLVAFVRGDYFVVLDVVEGAAAHQYSWVLHGAGRLAAVSPQRALWRTARQQLEVRWVHPPGLQVTRHRGLHCGTGARPEEHDYVKASIIGKRLVYLSVWLAGKRGAGRQVAPVTVAPPAAGVSIRRGTQAEHFVFDPWGSRPKVELGGRSREVRGQWAAFFEGPHGLRNRRQARGQVGN